MLSFIEPTFFFVLLLTISSLIIHLTGLGLDDNTWTPQVGGTSWPDSSKQQASAMPSDPGSSALDIYSIPEFVPGKLWSGIGIKNPDDDPSLTPASAAQIDMNSLSKNENPKVADSSNREKFRIGGAYFYWSLKKCHLFKVRNQQL
jgi:hypothetical protein